MGHPDVRPYVRDFTFSSLNKLNVDRVSFFQRRTNALLGGCGLCRKQLMETNCCRASNIIDSWLFKHPNPWNNV
jgi:hypothetical protein